MVDIPVIRIISSLGIILIEENSLFSVFLSYLLIRSSTLRTSSYSGAITNARPLTGFMDFMMNVNILLSKVNESTTSNSGNSSLMSSMSCLSLPLSIKKYCACMVASVLSFKVFNRFLRLSGQLKCPIRGCFVTCCGLIHKRAWRVGAKTSAG